MTKLYILSSMLLLFWFFSCSGRKGDAMQESVDSNPEFPRAQESIAPGNVEITGRLLTIDTTESGSYYHFRVEKVHGYGMGVRPLAEGSEIFISVLETRIQTDSLLAKKLMKADQSFRMTIGNERQAMEMRSEPVWQAYKIK